MRQAIETHGFRTPGRGLHEITGAIAGWAHAQGMTTGLLTLFCRHTSASLLIQENAAPAAKADLEAFFDRIAPEGRGLYAHDDEGPDDMPAHLRTALTATQLSIPLAGGRLVLGTWQGVYLFEHRRASHARQVVTHLLGE
jgi:secondary thiamine-phosphate synthase enzyme